MRNDLEVSVDSLFEGSVFVGDPELYPSIKVELDEKKTKEQGYPWVTAFEYRGEMIQVRGYVWSTPYHERLYIYYVEGWHTPMLMILYDPDQQSWRMLGMMP